MDIELKGIANMRQRAAKKIYDGLEEMILTNQFAEGDRLDEAQLARHFKVSRTPLREALQMLANNGLLELTPNKGAFVRKPSLIDVIEMFDVMAALESLCAQLAAQRISKEQLVELKDAVRQCEDAAQKDDRDAYYQANLNFHWIIYTASGNRFLSNETEKLKNRLTSYRRIQLQARGRLFKSQAEHQAILEAISDSDGARAYRLMNEHVAIQGQRFSDVMSKFRELEVSN